MSISRYQNDLPIKGGKIRKSAQVVRNLRQRYRAGTIGVREIVVKENERLDQIAGRELGEGSLWWIIAALSDIGWGMQIPPGTILKIPTNLQHIAELV